MYNLGTLSKHCDLLILIAKWFFPTILNRCKRSFSLLKDHSKSPFYGKKKPVKGNKTIESSKVLKPNVGKANWGYPSKPFPH